MQIEVYRIDGTLSGEHVDLPAGVFEVEPNDHAMWLAVKAYLAHQRQGTSKTKNRWEVRGGGRKPWRQKGRGTARSGSSRSPVWVGGGNVHGPKPRTYDLKVPKKVRTLARKSALSFKLKELQIRVVEDFSFETYQTKQMAGILKANQIGTTKALLLTPVTDDKVYRSGRNIPTLQVIEAAKASTYDILNNKMLLIQKSALGVLVRSVTGEEN
jgi:large subunit ribosomal protein L4